MSIISQVKNLCRDKKISLAKLEKDLEFGNGALRRWDVSSPSVDKVIKVSQYFGVSLDYLILGKENALQDTNKQILHPDQFIPVAILFLGPIEINN